MEHHLVLTRNGLAALPTLDRREGLDRCLLEAAMAADRTLEDVHRAAPGSVFDGGTRPALEELLARLRAEDSLVSAVPFSGRFHYAWILVELGRCEGLADGVLSKALQRTSRDECGLVLSERGLEGLPPQVDVLHFPREARGELGRLLYAHAILTQQHACRVLLTRLEDAALLSEALSRHKTALATDEVPELRDGTDLSRARKRGLPRLLEFLRTASTDDGLPEALPEARERALAGMVALLCTGNVRDAATRLRRVAFQGAVLGCGPAEIASQLTPLRVEALPQSKEVRTVRWKTLSGREAGTAPRRVAFACLHLLGDAISSTPSLHWYRVRFPDDHLTFFVADRKFAEIFELSPDIDRIAYVQLDQHQLVFGSSTAFLEGLPEWGDEFALRHAFDIQRVVRETRDLHMTEGYARLLGIELDSRAPVLDVERARRSAPETLPAEPFVVFSRHTVSGGLPGMKATEQGRRWSEGKWRQLATHVRRKLGRIVVSVGTPEEGRMELPGVVDLHDLSIRELAGTLARAEALVTIDNGVCHLGMAMRTPLVKLSPHWLNPEWTSLCRETPHRELRQPLARLPVEKVFDALRDLLAHASPAE